MRWSVILLLLVSGLSHAEIESEPSALERLFTTQGQRKQIDLERLRAMMGEKEEEVEEVDTTNVVNSDIHFQAILYRGDLPPLLWINGLKASLPTWQRQRDLLVVDALALDEPGLRITLDGQQYRLQPNQILNRETLEIVEAHQYQPHSSEPEPEKKAEVDLTKPDMGNVLKQAVSVNQMYKKMPEK